MLKNFTTQEKKIFWGCAICYMLAYVGRFNLAPALSGITETFALTAAQSGLIQTMLAAVYAVGQVVNGILADRVNCRRHITMGLIGTAVCNLLVGCASSYTQVLVLWALNGAFQSMLWTPVVRIMADWYEGEKRGRVTYYMCFTFIIGHFLAWAISGSMKSLANWRFAFWVPAAVMAANAVLAYTLLRDRREARAAEGTAPVETIARMPIRDMMFKTGLWAVLIGCVFTGIARDGVMTWAPSLIDSRAGTSLGSVTSSLIIPVLNLFGVLLARRLMNKANGAIRPALDKLMSAAAVVALVLAVFNGGSVYVFAVLLGMLCSLMYASSNLQNVMLPMAYAYTGRVSLVAGLCDCMIYLGMSLVAVLSGGLLQAFGQWAVYLSWAAAALLSLLMMHAAEKARKA